LRRKLSPRLSRSPNPSPNPSLNKAAHSEYSFGSQKAHGQPWVFLRQSRASSMPTISTSRPPYSGWSFSRMR
jgi:hypothetical protein